MNLIHLNGKNGITMLALTVTIIILLILAGISITTLTGDNGLIRNAVSAKEQAEIDGEKELIETSTVQAMGKNKYGNVTQGELTEKLNSNAGDSKTEVIDNGDILVVKFVDSGRYYEVDGNGNVSEPIEVILDEYAGDITKGGRCDGSEEKPFEINCIEDLVAFSQNVNAGNHYRGIYIKLMRTLDFDSIFSYNDYKTTEYDEYLGGDGKTALKQQLSQKGKGFIPIGRKSPAFCGTFDGNNCEINNIFENVFGVAGLFGYAGNGAKILNLSISGNITSIDGNAAGFVGSAGIVANHLGDLIIENCINKANINANSSAGGITTQTNPYLKPIINNCYNFGEITSKTTSSGGITGGYFYGNIMNSANNGIIISEDGYAGGITGYGLGFQGKIINCYNTGNITAYKEAGGINAYSSGTIMNSFNIGTIISSTSKASGISTGGWDYGTNTNAIIKNCYTFSNITGNQKAAITYNKIYLVENCYYQSGNDLVDSNGFAITDELIKADGKTDTEETKALVTVLNNYVSDYNSENENDENYIELTTWKLDGENCYPTFE